MQKDEPQLLNVQQSASFLGVKVSTIRLWAQTNKLKGIKVGSRGDWRFTKEELSKMIQVEKKKFIKIKKFLEEYAEEIQGLAHQNHLVHLGKDNVRAQYIEKYKDDYIEVIREFADNLENLKKGTIVFERLAERIAKKSIDNSLSLEEAVDGTIFLKQAFWQKLDQERLLHVLTTQDFYAFSHIITTYSDIVASKIAFAYHDYYSTQVANYLILNKEYEEKNKINKERFDLAIKAGNIGIYEWDIQTNKIIWTEELEAIYGFFPGGFKGDYNTALKANHPDDTKATINAVEQAIKQKKELDIEYRILWPDKTIHWVSAKGKTFYDQKGKPLRMIGIVTDITDQVLVRERIEKSEEYFRALANATSEVIYRMSPDWKDMHELHGRKFLADTGKPIRNWLQKYIHPKDQKHVLEVIKKAIQSKSIFQLEHQVIQADGTLGWKYSRVIPILNKNDEITEWFGAASDITERKQAEEALKESEARKTAFFETALDSIITMNAKGQIIEFNPAAEAMFGYSCKEAQGKELASLIIPSELRNKHRKGLSHYLNTGEEKILNKRIEIVALRKGGELFPVELTITKVPNTVEVLFTGTIQDITKRKEYENKLASSEERLRLALEAGQIGVWDWDIQNNTLVWSDRVYEFYGTTRENFAVTYENFSKQLFPEDKKKAEDAIKNAVEGKKEYDITYRILTLSGEIKWIASRAIVTRDKKGKPLRMLGATSDVTEQKKLEQDKNDFVSIATHELKTPVTSIKAYAQVLRKKFTRVGDEKSAGQLDKMNAQLDKLTSLIADLLDATKIESGRLQMQVGKFDFDELVSEIVEELQLTTENHIIIIKGKTHKNITADRERIGQVLTNLISNAIKYSPHTDKIIVQLSKNNKSLRLCVKDFGIGINKGKQSQIFERFYRVSGPKEVTFPGLGLGLYISSEIIKRLGGKIWVESKEHNGSTFCFTLPYISSIKQQKNNNVDAELQGA